jgi:RNA polymerase sigma-70 factor (ECF subfamily)
VWDVEGRRPNFEEAFRAEYPGVVRVVAPIVGSVADAEAVVQDAFVKAFTRWRRIGRYDRPGAWIRRVAVRDAVRFAERNRRGGPPPPGDADPTEAVAAAIDVQAALLELTPKQRACVVLHYLADWPVTRVAEAVGCREATVRVHLHRARSALADLLDATVDSEEITNAR